MGLKPLEKPNAQIGGGQVQDGVTRVASGWWQCPPALCAPDVWIGVPLNCASQGKCPTVGDKTLGQWRLLAFYGIVIIIHRPLTHRWQMYWKDSSEVLGRQPEEGPGQRSMGLQMCLWSSCGCDQLRRERSGLVPSHGRGGHLQEDFFFFNLAPTHFPLVISQQSSHQFIFKGTWLCNLCQGGMCRSSR